MSFLIIYLPGMPKGHIVLPGVNSLAVRYTLSIQVIQLKHPRKACWSGAEAGAVVFVLAVSRKRPRPDGIELWP